MIRITRHIRQHGGITLIEVIMVIVIAAILVTVAMKSVVTITESGRIEETKKEMRQLAWAICGNPELENNGVRTDFGYVGDIGSLPDGLDSLWDDPPTYQTWNGPYIQRRFTQIYNDHEEDAWGVDYTYSGGVEIVSTGSGSDIVLKLANSEDDLLRNRVTGIVLDRDGAPPGTDEVDSVTIRLTIPNGTGSTVTKSMHPDPSGYFAFDSIPIGNHDIEIIYIPSNDSLRRFVSVLPNSVLYQEYFLTFSPWSEIPPTSGCFAFVEGSAFTFRCGTPIQCDGIEFQIENTCGSTAPAESIILDWGATPDAYWMNLQWNNEAAYSGSADRVGSGELADFQLQKTIKYAEGGETVTIHVENFQDSESGPGEAVDMSNIDITVTLSDGSTFTFNTGTCSGGS